jgi:hypothetical protein
MCLKIWNNEIRYPKIHLWSSCSHVFSINIAILCNVMPFYAILVYYCVPHVCFWRSQIFPTLETPWLTVRCAGSPPLCSQPKLLAIPPMVIWHPRISHATIFPSSQVATSIFFWAHSSLTPRLKVGKWKYVPAALLNVYAYPTSIFMTTNGTAQPSATHKVPQSWNTSHSECSCSPSSVFLPTMMCG